MEVNEIVAIPSNQNVVTKPDLHINKLIFFLPLVLLIRNSSKEFTRKGNNALDLGSNLIASIDIEDLNEKVDILKKIGPYLPESIVGSLNSIVFFVEKAVKIIGLVELVASNKSYVPVVALDNLTNKDRINGILTTIKDEISDERVNNIRPVIDVVLNFDKYKALINMISSLNNMNNNKVEKLSSPQPKVDLLAQSNENKTEQIDSIINAIKPMLGNNEEKTSQIENMINIVKPMLENNENISTEKIGDMFKMLEMLNVLNTSKSKG